MSERQEKWIKFRLIIIFFLFVFLLTVVAVRAYQLQILQQTELVRLAERQRKIGNIVKKTLRETQHDVITHYEVWKLIKSKLK